MIKVNSCWSASMQNGKLLLVKNHDYQQKTIYTHRLVDGRPCRACLVYSSFCRREGSLCEERDRKYVRPVFCIPSAPAIVPGGRFLVVVQRAGEQGRDHP